MAGSPRTAIASDPGKNAHEVVCEAQKYVQERRRWVVDVDLEKFFDRVNLTCSWGSSPTA
jgi:retron-type reverse transcriptase